MGCKKLHNNFKNYVSTLGIFVVEEICINTIKKIKKPHEGIRAGAGF